MYWYVTQGPWIEMNSSRSSSSRKFTITGFLNIPEQRHYKGDPDGNTLWLWNPQTDFAEIKADLSLDSDLKIVK